MSTVELLLEEPLSPVFSEFSPSENLSEFCLLRVLTSFSIPFVLGDLTLLSGDVFWKNDLPVGKVSLILTGFLFGLLQLPSVKDPVLFLFCSIICEISCSLKEI